MKSKLRKSVAFAVSICFTAATLLSACSNGSDELAAELDSYEWAVFMSQYSGSGGLFSTDSSGFVVLVRQDGSYDLISHGGMDSGSVSWTEHGMYFADEKRDHWINGQSSKVVKQGRVGLMDGLVTLSDGVTRVGVYNAGFKNNGYQEEVVVAGPEASEYRALNTVGFYPLISACGDDVYAAYSMTPEDGNTRFIFDQIVDKGAIAHTILNTETLPFSELAFYANDAPCVAGQIYFLGDFIIYDGEKLAGDETLASNMHREEDGHQHAFALLVVDGNTGTLNWFPLVTDYAEGLEISAGEFGYSALDANSLDKDGNLVWIAGNGILYKTEVATGHTTVLNGDLESGSDEGIPQRLYHFTSDQDTASVLVEDNQDPLAMPQIVVFDKSTGQILKKVPIKGLKDTVSQGMILRDIAQKPAK